MKSTKRKFFKLLLVAPFVFTLGISLADNSSGVPGSYSNFTDTGDRDLSRRLGIPDYIPMSELLPNLLTVIDQITKYRAPDSLPDIKKVPHSVIEDYACGEPCAALAVYRSGDGIYLDESMDPETDVFARSVLLHELVHYVQDIHKELAGLEDCERWFRREREAYHIQKRFLGMVGSRIRVGYAAGDICSSSP